MKKKAFTLVELMVAIILMVLVLTALWNVFSSAQKNAKEVVENHTINHELDMALIRILDDVREANFVATDSPAIYEESQINSDALKTTAEESNQLKFKKVKYDFSKDPSSLGDNEKNYTAVEIIYRVEKDEIAGTNNENSKWYLIREMTPLDTNNQRIESEMTAHTILSGIDECVFYRIKDPEAVRSGNVYIRIQVGRKEAEKYKNECVISVKERGAMPES